MRVGRAEPAGDREARVDVELEQRAAEQCDRAAVAGARGVGEILPARRSAAAAVEAEVERAGVDRVAVDLERLACLEQRLAERVVAPAEEHRAEDADSLVWEV